MNSGWVLAGLLFSAVVSPASAGGFDRAYGLDLHGGDYDEYRRVTLDQCQYFCNRDDRCVAYAFIVSRRWCWLKDSRPRGFRNDDVISGVKNN